LNFQLGNSSLFIKLARLQKIFAQFGTKHSLNISVSAGVVIWDLFSRIKSEK